MEVSYACSSECKIAIVRGNKEPGHDHCQLNTMRDAATVYFNALQYKFRFQIDYSRLRQGLIEMEKHCGFVCR